MLHFNLFTQCPGFLLNLLTCLFSLIYHYIINRLFRLLIHQPNPISHWSLFRISKPPFGSFQKFFQMSSSLALTLSSSSPFSTPSQDWQFLKLASNKYYLKNFSPSLSLYLSHRSILSCFIQKLLCLCQLLIAFIYFFINTLFRFRRLMKNLSTKRKYHLICFL